MPRWRCRSGVKVLRLRPFLLQQSPGLKCLALQDPTVATLRYASRVATSLLQFCTRSRCSTVGQLCQLVWFVYSCRLDVMLMFQLPSGFSGEQFRNSQHCIIRSSKATSTPGKHMPLPSPAFQGQTYLHQPLPTLCKLVHACLNLAYVCPVCQAMA